MLKRLLSAVAMCAFTLSSALAGTDTIVVPPGSSGETYQNGTNGSGNHFGYFSLCDFAACAQGLSINLAGTSGTNAAAVQGITGGVAMPVSAAALPLPTGAATSANQATGNTSAATTATNTGTIATNTAITAAGTSATSGLPVQGMTGGVALPVTQVQPFYNVASSTLTRASNTTAYSSTAGATVCLLTSGTPCVPITLSIANTNQGKGTITRFTMVKSGSTTAGANFVVYMFSAAPVLTTPTQYDATAYAGPRAADMPNYIGSAACSNAQPTSDTTAQVWYECTLSNPNAAGQVKFQALSGGTTIDMLLVCTATSTNTYTPASAETFQFFASGDYY